VRPTTEDLAHASDDLEQLAYGHDPNGSPRSNTGFPEMAGLLNLLVWADQEIRAAERAAAYGPGVKDGYHTLQRGGSHSDLDARTHDAHAKAVRNLRSGWRVEAARMFDEWRTEAMEVGRYPTRSEQEAV
jgi:hypothetical protein